MFSHMLQLHQISDEDKLKGKLLRNLKFNRLDVLSEMIESDPTILDLSLPGVCFCFDKLNDSEAVCAQGLTLEGYAHRWGKLAALATIRALKQSIMIGHSSREVEELTDEVTRDQDPCQWGNKTDGDHIAEYIFVNNATGLQLFVQENSIHPDTCYVFGNYV